MKKVILSVFAVLLMSGSSFAATWVAADRVAPVGKVVVEKSGLPAKTTFKVVNGAADNSMASTTDVIQISSTDLTYAGNDNEVAAVISSEIGQIINGKAAKDKFRSAAKAALAEKLSATNVLNTAANSEYVTSKTTLSDMKVADMTGVDLMVNAGYNPLAMVVVITKHPGSNLEIIMGKPANSERAMNVFNYITYNYPDKITAGYGCQEYRNFLTYADPIVQKRNKSKGALKKFNKEQEKAKALRAKSLAQYKATGGMSSWDATYAILNELSTDKK